LLENNGIRVLIHAANTTHFAQVNDGYIFGVLGKNMNVLIPQKMRDARLLGESVAGLSWGAYYEARGAAYTSAVITASFRDRGVYPFDPRLILALTRRNLGITGDDTAHAITDMAVAATQTLVRQAGERHVTPELVTAAVKRETVYTGAELLERAAVLRAAIAAKKTSDAAAKEQKAKVRCAQRVAVPGASPFLRTSWRRRRAWQRQRPLPLRRRTRRRRRRARCARWCSTATPSGPSAKCVRCTGCAARAMTACQAPWCTMRRPAVPNPSSRRPPPPRQPCR